MCIRVLLTFSVRFTAIFGLLGLFAFGARAAIDYTEAPGSEGDGKFTTGPEYKIDPDLTDRSNPKGKSFEFSLRLADSRIFRGDDTTLEPEKKPVRKERIADCQRSL